MTLRQRWTLVATIIGSGIVFLDGTIVNVALPRIGRDLPASFIGVLEGQTYIVSGYLAVLAALLILAGALSDHYGRRRVFGIGLTLFGVTSVICGLAPTLELLTIARLFQGAAGALLVPGSLAIITNAFEGQQRARAFGIWAAATSALVVLGPITGGVLVDSVGWRAAFLVNVPLILVALFALRHVEESRDTSGDGRFDWLGSLVATLAVGGLAFGVIRGEQKAWADPVAWIALAIGAISLVAFPILMAKRPHPLVPLELFRDRTFAAINLATFFIYGALYISQSYQGLLVQGVLGYTATAAGAIGLPAGIMLTLLSTRVGTLAGRIGSRGFLVAGPLIMAAGLLWFVRLPSDSAAWEATLSQPATLIPPPDVLIDVLPAVLLFGLGIALIVAPLTSTLMNSVPTTRLRARIRHQQLDLAGRGAARRSADLHCDQCDVLFGARIADRARHERLGHPPGIPAAQPTARRRHRGAARGGPPGVGRSVPPGHARVGRPARRRWRGVVPRAARLEGRGRGS